MRHFNLIRHLLVFYIMYVPHTNRNGSNKTFQLNKPSLSNLLSTSSTSNVRKYHPIFWKTVHTVPIPWSFSAFFIYYCPPPYHFPAPPHPTRNLWLFSQFPTIVYYDPPHPLPLILWFWKNLPTPFLFSLSLSVQLQYEE